MEEVMKYKFIALMIIVCLFGTACGDTKYIDGINYDTYGILNSDDNKNPKIKYEVIWGNVIWGSLLFGTVIAPIYFFGFSMFEPVGRKTGVKGEVYH
jgi:hypothetical protein